MNIVFFGSSSFSVPALKSISHSVICVVTKKAKPKGRGYMFEDNEVKRTALDIHLPLIEIESFKDESTRKLKQLKPELFVVASFGLIVPKWALDLPTIGAINVHPSLLPKYRGPSPIQWAIWNGEEETGITLIRMNEKMDAGNILYQENMVIKREDNMITLSERLSKRASEILPGFIERVGNFGMEDGIVQNHEEATYTPIITKEMGRIDWYAGAMEIVRQIKALVLWPTAYTFLDGRILKIFDGEMEGYEGKEGPGVVSGVSKDGIYVSTHNGALVIKEVQLENKKRMKAYEFANGYRGLNGKTLG
jgi:methionyl-tRNA formyltransferase